MGERDARTGVLPREGLEIKIDTERERERKREITTCRLDSEKKSPSPPLDSAECYIGLRRALFSCSLALTFWHFGMCCTHDIYLLQPPRRRSSSLLARLYWHFSCLSSSGPRSFRYMEFKYVVNVRHMHLCIATATVGRKFGSYTLFARVYFDLIA